MNLYLQSLPGKRPHRIAGIDRPTAFGIGVFVGLMLPLWIKILTR